MYFPKVLKDVNALDDANFSRSGDMVKEGHIRYGSIYPIELGAQIA